MAVRVRVSMDAIVVAARAHGLQRKLRPPSLPDAGVSGVAPAKILASGYRLQVVRVDTAPDAAQMIQIQSGRHGATRSGVHNPMCLLVFAVQKRLPIAIEVDRRRPQPTAAHRLRRNVRPDPGGKSRIVELHYSLPFPRMRSCPAWVQMTRTRRRAAPELPRSMNAAPAVPPATVTISGEAPTAPAPAGEIAV